MELIENLKWRYATKKMNGQTVPQEKLDYILEAARLAPSSSGLQPYKIFVISDKELLAKIKDVAYNQDQITDCSHLLVFASWDGYSFDRMGEVFHKTAKERELPYSILEDFHKTIWGIFEPLPAAYHQAHTARQAYISFGMAIAAAAEQRVDACPMDGFLPDKVDELLELDKYGLKSVAFLALGYRAAEGDWLVNLKKVRTPKEEFIIEKV
ncbi:NAD(P)H-dependent oxidoreductase [Parapedobacter tibetensis]|uniref:NAD(P)H-dependent oxidoreductase n=1 Tax=Parapedobacter tibetensis TaxID=2972951 RepID=UPI00214D52DF|nr:NAD(P)H-dependent oxidoreductase [Parapedobacter tibetensis]